jgi:hypothetical protein
MVIQLRFLKVVDECLYVTLVMSLSGNHPDQRFDRTEPNDEFLSECKRNHLMLVDGQSGNPVVIGQL